MSALQSKATGGQHAVNEEQSVEGIQPPRLPHSYFALGAHRSLPHHFILRVALWDISFITSLTNEIVSEAQECESLGV